MLGPIFIAVAAVAAAPVGVYESRQPEVAAGLQLSADGRFRYALDYGAVSEIAEGKWTSDGRTVRLTSDPMPRAPGFEIVRDDPAPPGELWVTFEDPGFDWGGPLEMLATVNGISGLVRVSPNERGQVETGYGRVTAIRPIIPVYDEITAPLSLSPNSGHRITVRFLRNDLGKARFRDQPLAIDGGGLRLDRYETTIKLVRTGN